MPRLKEETRAKLKAEIESAALECFITRGYSATTTREIATKVGLTAGALYSHYPSKEALFASVVESYRKRLTEDPENPVRRTLLRMRFPHDMADLAGAIKQVVGDHRAYWKLWYVDVIEFEGRHFKSALAPQSLLDYPGLKDQFQKLRAEGRLRVDPQVAYLMTTMHLFNYFLVETLFGGQDHYGLPEGEAIAAMSDVFLHGLLRSEA